MEKWESKGMGSEDKEKGGGEGRGEKNPWVLLTVIPLI